LTEERCTTQLPAEQAAEAIIDPLGQAGFGGQATGVAVNPNSFER